MIDDLDVRFGQPPQATQVSLNIHADVRNRCRVLADFINVTVPDGREKSLAITNLEQAMFWANAAIARNS